MAKINYYKYLKYLLTRKFYYAVARSYPVWYFLVNRESRALFNQNKPKLDAVQERIAGDLKKRGVATADAKELFGNESFVIELRKFAEQARLSQSAKKGDQKQFLTYLLGATPPEIRTDSPVTAFAAHPKILDAVNAYFGVVSKLHELDLNITHVISPEEARAGSQRWHRDPEDKKICKVFLYLTDVDETSGPFNYIVGSQYGGKWRGLFPQRPPAGNYPPDGAVEKIVPKEDMRAFTGRAGTIIFCDTSGLHRGGYATGKERIMLTAGFVTNGCASGPKFQYAPKP